jgi:hypothetical protein
MRTPAEDTGVRAPVRIPVVAENTPIMNMCRSFFAKESIRYIELTLI